jgi:hypothetical protein
MNKSVHSATVSHTSNKNKATKSKHQRPAIQREERESQPPTLCRKLPAAPFGASPVVGLTASKLLSGDEIADLESWRGRSGFADSVPSVVGMLASAPLTISPSASNTPVHAGHWIVQPVALRGARSPASTHLSPQTRTLRSESSGCAGVGRSCGAMRCGLCAWRRRRGTRMCRGTSGGLLGRGYPWGSGG